MRVYTKFIIAALAFLCFAQAQATKLVEVKVVDKDYLLLFFKDGEVNYVENVNASDAYVNFGIGGNSLVTYGTALSTTAAATASNWKISSTDDSNFGTTGLAPTAVYRKSKLNGLSQGAWSTSDFIYSWAYDHSIYLKLPKSMTQGKTYTITINTAVNATVSTATIKFDIYNSRSESIKVNLVGYSTKTATRAADVYEWMGDGGSRDYTSFVGKDVLVYDVNAKTSQKVGSLSFWKSAAKEFTDNRQLIATPVWNADFTGFNTPGTYRLVVDGIGCSQDFVIGADTYADPFKISTIGFYYMRLGEAKTARTPVPTQPQWIQDVAPSDCKVYLTNMQPYHSEWSTFGSGDKWDLTTQWNSYRKSGNPTNAKAYGGHRDAMDLDRHLGHVVIIYDMLLPYFLSNGAISDDNIGIPESGNGIPDVIDEARNEVDFWLRLRDGKGYSHGLNNPNSTDHYISQAGITAVAAWANATNAAMLANCLQIAGKTTLANVYRDSAIAAFTYAQGLADQQLTKTQNMGAGDMTGADLKLTAAAFLYNVTGLASYETIVNDLSSCKSSVATIKSPSSNQLYAAAAYLFTNQKVNYSTLYANLKTQIVSEAKAQEANYILTRPSRRSSDNNHGWFVTEMCTQRCIIAHAVSAEGSADKTLFENALVLEADWTLGRNPLNMIQMTTATTSLAGKRSVENMYTSGWNDGTPGLHPGHTPYMNIDDWGGGMWMGNPSKMTAQNYPAVGNWPMGELYYNVRYIYAANEFTPQQTMRGKQALYGYLYSLGPVCDRPNLGPDVSICGSTSLVLNANLSATGRTFVWKKDGQTIAGQTGNTLTITSAGSYEVTSTEGTCVKTDKIEVLSTLPKPALGDDFTLCTPSIKTLDAGVNGTGIKFAWLRNGIAQPNATTSKLTVYDKGQYVVQVSATGCTATADTIVVSSNLLSVLNDTICAAGTATLKTSATAGTFNWYAAVSGGTALGTGTSYQTAITTDTVFYVEDAAGFSGSLGPKTLDDYKATGSDAKKWTSSTGQTADKVKFQVLSKLTFKSVKIYLGTATSVTIRLLAADMTTVVHTVTQAVSGTEAVIVLNKELTPGIYYIDANGTNGTIWYNGDGSNVPAFSTIKIDNLITILATEPAWVESNKRWEFYYDWQITAGNACARTPVRALIDPKTCGNTTVTQNIALQAGWNLISINVRPSDSTIATLFTGLDVKEIKNMDAFWRKGQTGAFNGLEKLTIGDGYLVNMNILGTLSVTGTPITFSNFQINAFSNWQLIGCPYQTATPFSTNFNSTNCSAIKNFEGFWIPSGTSNSIQNQEPGKGYFIKK